MFVRRRHDKDDVRWRLFQGFQQSIEGLRRKHVHFVNDEHLESITGRLDTNIRNDHVANIVDAGVRRCVDFQDIHRAAFGDLATRRAGRLVQRGARRGSWSLGFVTVKGFGDQPRGRGLADAAGAGKKISVMQPAVLNRIAQRLGQDFLPGYVFEFLWAPLARDYLISHKKVRSDPGLSRNTRCCCYRCSVPGLAGFTKRALCGARDLISH